jgi:hypothetical protein
MKRALIVALLPLASFAGGASTEPPPPGNVTLPLGEYRRLREASAERLKHPRPAPTPPVLQSARLTLTPGDESAFLETELELTVSSAGNWKLPLPKDGALLTWSSMPSGAWITGDGGDRALCAARPGRYQVSLQAALPIASEGGLSRVLVSAPDAASVALRVRLASADQDARISEGALERDPSGRLLTGTLPRGKSVALDFRARERAEEKARFTSSRAELFSLVAGENLREGVAELNVLSGRLSSLSLRLPVGETLETVSGDGVAGYERDEKDRDRVVVTLLPPARGRFRLYWRTSRVSPTHLVPAAIEQSEGGEAYLAARGGPGTELAAKENPGMERADPKDLTPLLRALLPESAVLLYRLAPEAPASGAFLSVESKSFPEVAGLDPVVEWADVTSVFTRDGQRLDRWSARIKTRNGTFAWPQPEGSSLWSVFVNGKPVKPSGEGAETKIPLRGSSGNALLDVVVSRPGVKFVRRGDASLDLPVPPAPIVGLAWNLYFPSGLRYRFREGNMRPAPEPIAAPEEASAAEGGTLAEYTGTGVLRGKVTDESGGVLPGVTVRLSGVGPTLVTTTGSQGEFQFFNLAPGRYTATTELSGFATVERSNVLVGENAGTELTIPMKVASVATTITVTSEVPLLDTRKQTSGATFTQGEMTASGGAGAPGGVSRPSAAAPPPPQARPRREESRVAAANIAQQFQQGLKSLPIEIPSEGKLIRTEGRLFFGQVPSVRVDYKE